MPKLWNATIEAHRHEVTDAILATTLSLVEQLGIRNVTMLQIAEKAGIGRATLYKYFPDVEAILFAWHQRHVEAHLAQLATLRHGTGDAAARLHAVLEAYALIQHERRPTELAALMHRGEHVAHAQRHLTELFRGLLAEGVETGAVRDDVGTDELAGYCLHALSAASSLRSKAAARRLAAVTMAGLRPER